jgi:hypothetical protein
VLLLKAKQGKKLAVFLLKAKGKKVAVFPLKAKEINIELHIKKK